MPDPVNLTIKLNPTRRRMARTTWRMFTIIANSDAKLYTRNPPKAFLPIFPTNDVALQAAITLIKDRLYEVVFGEEE